MLRIAEHFHDSDLGRQRQGNEDNYFVRAPLFVVADGMGGAQAGEVASEMAVESFADGLPPGPPGEGLVTVIEWTLSAKTIAVESGFAIAPRSVQFDADGQVPAVSAGGDPASIR